MSLHVLQRRDVAFSVMLLAERRQYATDMAAGIQADDDSMYADLFVEGDFVTYLFGKCEHKSPGNVSP